MVSGTLCQALLVTLPVKIPHVPHVKSIIGGRMVLVGVVMVSIGQCSEMQSNIRFLPRSCMFLSLGESWKRI